MDEATQKKLSGAVQAAQSLITDLQNMLSFTIKTTIDPGITSVVVDTENDTAAFIGQRKDGKVDNSGLIAIICPSKKQIGDLKIFSNTDSLFSLGRTACDALPMLKVGVYLDFTNGHSTMYGPEHLGDYEQTDVGKDQLYRDAAYIPVSVWRGQKEKTEVIERQRWKS